jgi:CheY-like chemotaxis protein
MTATRPRLVLLKGKAGDWEARERLRALTSVADIVEVENAAEARALVAQSDPGSVLLSAEVAESLAAETPPAESAAHASAVLQHVGQGLGLVDRGGTLTWASGALSQLPEETRRRFTELCRGAIDQLDARREDTSAARFNVSAGAVEYELAVSPAARDAAGRVSAVVGVLWDVTASRRLQQTIDAIDAAGAELMRIESSTIRRLNMADRLRLLERKIVQYVRDLLQFDHFEIRLLDRQSQRLELVVVVGLTPLNIGEVIHARPEGNGISGWVACTGQSYLCNDVRHDPMYREGLDNAASSLTVPLRLFDEVIGVFNVESNTPNAFDDNDRQFAEIFGRYVAMAMHILDLLVVERYTTNEQLSADVLGELSAPIDEITRRADDLCANRVPADRLTAELERIRSAAADIRARILSCTRGPHTILGAEAELQRHEVDPVLKGARVLLADNEEEIRNSLHRILTQKGCAVTVCQNGIDTIQRLESAARDGDPYQLIISDIKMPDRTGYEIFRAARAAAPATKVILMTGFGYDPHHSIIRASQEGLHSLLFKPLRAAQLLETVRKAVVAPEGPPATAGCAASEATGPAAS